MMLKNVYTGCTNKTTLALLTHLYSHYARICTTYMEENDEKIRSHYKAEKTLKGIIYMINECVDFAAGAGEMVTETQLVRITYELVVKMGQYNEDCRSWRTHEKSTVRPFIPTSSNPKPISERGNKHCNRAATKTTTLS